ncbi:hypothetical protein QJS66_06690 [Kocuria rhizophila]|nr:hypothetical protein QJS66_06690 [Kocuria rhizophila]
MGTLCCLLYSLDSPSWAPGVPRGLPREPVAHGLPSSAPTSGWRQLGDLTAIRGAGHQHCFDVVARGGRPRNPRGSGR